MEYTIKHKEILVGYYSVEAESEEEAMEKFENMSWRGDLDFSDLEVVDTVDTVVEPPNVLICPQKISKNNT